MDVKERINKLIKKLTKWSKYYYQENTSLVSDEVYDQTLQELKDLEKTYPSLIRSDSPTQLIGFKPSKKLFAKVKHSSPMLSLDNAFNYDDIKKFFTQIRKHVDDAEFICEYKIDGVSISVIYENDVLVQALTRGDGIIGEDITHTAIHISNIPKKIQYKRKITIRGEVYWELNEFTKRNKELQKNNKDAYKNPRNAVSGLLRQLKTDGIKQANLSVAFYDIVEKNIKAFKTQIDIFAFFKEKNIPHLQNWKYVKMENVQKTINAMINEKPNLNLQTDGIVLKVNDFQLRDEIGRTSKFPKWAIAYKSPAITRETKIKKIFVTVGRTGRVTYNAKLEPVKLTGSIIEFATLHNFAWLSEKDIRENDIVSIRKAGDIIPEVVDVNFKKRPPNTEKFKIVEICPFCSNKFVSLPGEVDQYCKNENCSEVQIKKIIHFVSRNALEIQSISDETIRKLYKKKWLVKLEDLFTLHMYFDKWILEKGFKKKSVHGVLSEIAKLKQNANLEKFIFGLGIKHVGKVASRKIVNAMKSLTNIINASLEDFLAISDIGEKSAEELYDFFHNQKNKKLLNTIQLHVNFLTIDENLSNKLKGIKFVITGVLTKPRVYYEDLINQHGGIVSSTISKKTNFVIKGNNPGSKIEKAKKLNIKIINEIQFEELFNAK